MSFKVSLHVIITFSFFNGLRRILDSLLRSGIFGCHATLSQKRALRDIQKTDAKETSFWTACSDYLLEMGS